jgi:outer membrane protein OmpA-like peptidoglycan-associated protein
MQKNLIPAAALAAALAACGTSPPVAEPPPAPTRDAGVPLNTLAAEQVRLSALFRGTPVVFSMRQDSSLRVTVPRHYCFGPGATEVKAPLAAVLDRLAKSQLHERSRFSVTAPSDPRPGGPALARARALSVRDHLVGQGIAAARIRTAGTLGPEQIELIVADGP